jgi:hypothetical protein
VDVAVVNSHILNLTHLKTKDQDHHHKKNANVKLLQKILKVHQEGTPNKANTEKKNLTITEAL